MHESHLSLHLLDPVCPRTICTDCINHFQPVRNISLLIHCYEEHFKISNCQLEGQRVGGEDATIETCLYIHHPKF